MPSLSAPGSRPKTHTSPDAAGTRPRIMCRRVVLPAPLAPINATMPPAGTSKGGPDQIKRPPRTAPTAVNVSAVQSLSALDRDTQGLRQSRELSVLPRLERGLSGRHGLGDVDDGHAGLLGRGANLLGDGALGLGVVDQHVDLPARENRGE